MLVGFVVVYLLISVGIGLWVASRVHNIKDYAVAGRHLPLPIVMATVFATWFGAEAVFGVSATFVREGLQGVVADPFGSSMCLIIAGWFFSRKLYALNIITLGDFYRLRYNRTIEVLTTLAIVISYLGWVAAQIKALGLIFNLITHGAVSKELGMVLGISIVLTYTTLGGMLSVAILDFIQMTVVIGGLLYIAYLVSGMTGGVTKVIAHAHHADKLLFFPQKADWHLWLTFIGTWVTMMLGSVPQQDVFQRITSAKSARIALWGSILGASLYFCFTFVPMFIAYSATLIDPKLNMLVQTDSQYILPTLVLTHTPLLAQAIFFGAVLSAIMSCSSATLLAPSIAFSENIVRYYMPNLSDYGFLKVMRLTLLVCALCVLWYALSSNLSIFGMVESAYKITLAGAFVPLVFGAYWHRATNFGALLAIVAGISTWIISEVFMPRISYSIPPQLLGLFASILGMLIGSLSPYQISGTTPSHPKFLVRHAAHTHKQ